MVNQAIVEDPALVNADPQGAGWFFKLRIEDPKAMDGLMDGCRLQEADRLSSSILPKKSS